MLLFALVFGVIGYIDDYVKVKKHQNTGLTAPQKFLLQLAAAIVFTVLMRNHHYLTPDLYIPFVNVTLSLPWPVYMVFAAFVMVGTVNAVNITDGIDGLCMSIPAVVGRNGVEDTLEIPLSPAEREALRDSAATLRGVVDSLEL